jgi:hypothetical protein
MISVIYHKIRNGYEARARCIMPAISVIGRLRQVFKASLGYLWRLGGKRKRRKFGRNWILNGR